MNEKIIRPSLQLTMMMAKARNNDVMIIFSFFRSFGSMNLMMFRRIRQLLAMIVCLAFSARACWWAIIIYFESEPFLKWEKPMLFMDCMYYRVLSH